MKKKIFIIILSLVSFLTIDRFLFMHDRVEEGRLWLHEAGRGLGDPISYGNDFEIKGAEVIFFPYIQSDAFPVIAKNRKARLYLFGCYFSYLLIYDSTNNEMITYFKK